jgi:hypothetical protein
MTHVPVLRPSGRAVSIEATDGAFSMSPRQSHAESWSSRGIHSTQRAGPRRPTGSAGKLGFYRLPSAQRAPEQLSETSFARSGSGYSPYRTMACLLASRRAA